ncbi:MAG: 2-hydroxychromene-2-carboxylate isomerase [Rubrivivax sp.]
MALHIDYYFAPQSPWTYLGHQRFADMAHDAGAVVSVLPVDLGKVFPVSGGLPLPKRAPQRQAYRLVELKRFSEWLKLPLNLQPKHFPVPGDHAARLILATDLHHGTDAAMRLAGRLMAAVWAEELNIDDAATRLGLLQRSGLPSTLEAAAQDAAVQARYEAATKQAIDVGIFGAPSYVIDGEVFWGQDRLDFVERRLAQAQRR